MDELLTDEQQAERVKKWLSENGAALLLGLLLGLGGLFAWSQWQKYQDQETTNASETYEELVEALRSQRPERAVELEGELANDFAGSPYLDQARFLLAKAYLDRNESEKSMDYLSRVVAKASAEPMRRIAQLRLARVKLHQQNYADALAVLENIDENSAFGPQFHEIRGDIYAAMDQPEDARREYATAMGAVEPGVIDRAFVQAKLDALGAVPLAQAAEDSAAADTE